MDAQNIEIEAVPIRDEATQKAAVARFRELLDSKAVIQCKPDERDPHQIKLELSLKGDRNAKIRGINIPLNDVDCNKLGLIARDKQTDELLLCRQKIDNAKRKEANPALPFFDNVPELSFEVFAWSEKRAKRIYYVLARLESDPSVLSDQLREILETAANDELRRGDTRNSVERLS
jgi:hypothetical protein